jgi:hypothetical protein
MPPAAQFLAARRAAGEEMANNLPHLRPRQLPPQKALKLLLRGVIETGGHDADALVVDFFKMSLSHG